MNYSSLSDVVQRIKICLGGAGADVEQLFDHAGIDLPGEGAARAVDALALSDQFSCLWHNVAAAAGDPLLGFHVSAADPISWLGVIGHLLLASPTLQQGADSVRRYLPLVSPIVRASIDVDPRRTRLSLQLNGRAHAVPLQRYDFTWNLLLATLRFVAARPALAPVRVEYACAAPPSASAYASQFGCPVHFGGDANALEFANADLQAPIPTANPLAAAGLQRLLDERLAQLEASSFSARVRTELEGMIDQGGALRETVARRLLISERTLQRRLAGEGTDFSTLVDDVRRALAARHLGNDRQSMKNLSYKLGFADPSAFHRACLRWFGKAPGEFQAHGKASAPTAAAGPASTARRSE